MRKPASASPTEGAEAVPTHRPAAGGVRPRGRVSLFLGRGARVAGHIHPAGYASLCTRPKRAAARTRTGRNSNEGTAEQPKASPLSLMKGKQASIAHLPEFHVVGSIDQTLWQFAEESQHPPSASRCRTTTTPSVVAVEFACYVCVQRCHRLAAGANIRPFGKAGLCARLFCCWPAAHGAAPNRRSTAAEKVCGLRS